jgi:hypothetical protein
MFDIYAAIYKLPDFLSGYLSLLWEERASKRNHEEQEAAHAEHLHGSRA